LKRRISELSKDVHNIEIGKLENELASYQSDVKKVSSHFSNISIISSLFLPLIFFICSLTTSIIGILFSAEITLVGAISAFLFFGIFFISRTLFSIEKSAKLPETLISFGIYFNSYSSKEIFKPSEKKDVIFLLHNLGRGMAEDLAVHLYFPCSFKLEQSPVPQGGIPRYGFAGIYLQDKYTDYPGCLTLSYEFPNLHEDMIMQMGFVKIEAPPEKGIYKINVRIWEKKLGKIEDLLTIEVA